jgi:hypothetical protein
MKIVVIGATGTIGQRVAKEALSRGHQVIGVVRDPASVQAPDPRVRLVKGDATKAGDLAEVVWAQLRPATNGWRQRRSGPCRPSVQPAGRPQPEKAVRRLGQGIDVCGRALAGGPRGMVELRQRQAGFLGEGSRGNQGGGKEGGQEALATERHARKYPGVERPETFGMRHPGCAKNQYPHRVTRRRTDSTNPARRAGRTEVADNRAPVLDNRIPSPDACFPILRDRSELPEMVYFGGMSANLVVV